MDTQKHVFSKYPVDHLPIDLRTGFERGAFVRITVESEEAGEQPLVSLIGRGKGIYNSPGEAIRVLREMRNEWKS